jgi:hypothetical protein
MSIVIGSPPATAATTATPSVELFKPTSSTYVAAGQNVNVAYSFKNVISRPYVTLYFRKDYGVRQAVNLNVSTNYVTVPAAWTSGTYRLDSIAVENIDHSKGEHFRSYLYVGTDASGNVYRYYTHLNLAVMDIHVQNGK